jgi:hypothetical protein
MDAPIIEEMGVPVDKIDFTEKEVDDLLFYCQNDVIETYHNYQYVVGDVDHPLYKDNNQIEIREALKDKFDINCINWSNSKYGDEIIKTIYCREANIKYKDLPRKGTFRKVIKFKHGIPSYVEFQTPALKDFLSRMKEKEISASDDFEEFVPLDGQIHTFALGGIHNKIENKQYHSDDEYIIIDADVTGYYPRTIINNQFYPAHLKKQPFLKAYGWVMNERETLKPQAKTDKRIKGIVNGYKEAANACYGKSGDVTNWLYDPQMRLNICIAGEMSILMLIERQYLAGNSCIMSNTDGATFYIKRSNIDKFYEVCNEWCKLTNYALEYFEFQSLWFLSVNDYLGLKMDGEVKAKGDFLIHTELHKNKSFRAIPLALHEYFIKGVPVDEFINKFDNIFHFCARSSAGKTYRHVGYTRTEQFSLSNLIRYYVSKDGINIKKIVREDSDSTANDANVQPADRKKITCNRLLKEDFEHHLQSIDRQWYIDKANEIVFRIERGKRPKKQTKINPNQTSLF